MGLGVGLLLWILMMVVGMGGATTFGAELVTGRILSVGIGGGWRGRRGCIGRGAWVPVRSAFGESVGGAVCGAGGSGAGGSWMGTR